MSGEYNMYDKMQYYWTLGPVKLAEAFNPNSDVPKELESNGWAFMGLIDVTNFTSPLEGKSGRTFSDISGDTTLSRAYLDKLTSIYTSRAYQDWSDLIRCGDRKLQKEIIDAWLRRGAE